MGQTEAPQKPPSLAWSQQSILYLFTRTFGAAPPSGTSQEPVRDPERAGAQPADELLPAAAESLTLTSPSSHPVARNTGNTGLRRADSSVLPKFSEPS